MNVCTPSVRILFFFFSFDIDHERKCRIFFLFFSFTMNSRNGSFEILKYLKRVKKKMSEIIFNEPLTQYNITEIPGIVFEMLANVVIRSHRCSA